MKSMVVYDSVYGNTEQIARAIGNALGSGDSAISLQVSKIKLEHLTGLELLIVGSPTRAFKPTRAITNFLNEIPSNGLKGIKVSAFDTRISINDTNSWLLDRLVKLFGYAANPIADKLVKKGGDLIIPPEGFYVKDSKGPLKDGELERAADWAQQFIK